MELGEDVEMPTSKCTSCGKELDGATCVGEDAKPNAGDFTVCIGCGHIMVFDENSMLREMTSAEVIEIAGDKRVLAVQWARGKIKDNAP